MVNITAPADLLKLAVQGFDALAPHADGIEKLFSAVRASNPELLTDLMNGNASKFINEARKLDNLDPAAGAVLRNSDFGRLLERAASNQNIGFLNDLHTRLKNGQIDDIDALLKQHKISDPAFRQVAESAKAYQESAAGVAARSARNALAEEALNRGAEMKRLREELEPKHGAFFRELDRKVHDGTLNVTQLMRKHGIEDENHPLYRIAEHAKTLSRDNAIERSLQRTLARPDLDAKIREWLARGATRHATDGNAIRGTLYGGAAAVKPLVPWKLAAGVGILATLLLIPSEVRGALAEKFGEMTKMFAEESWASLETIAPGIAEHLNKHGIGYAQSVLSVMAIPKEMTQSAFIGAGVDPQHANLVSEAIWSNPAILLIEATTGEDIDPVKMLEHVENARNYEGGMEAYIASKLEGKATPEEIAAFTARVRELRAEGPQLTPEEQSTLMGELFAKIDSDMASDPANTGRLQTEFVDPAAPPSAAAPPAAGSALFAAAATQPGASGGAPAPGGTTPSPAAAPTTATPPPAPLTEEEQKALLKEEYGTVGAMVYSVLDGPAGVEIAQFFAKMIATVMKPLEGALSLAFNKVSEIANIIPHFGKIDQDELVQGIQDHLPRDLLASINPDAAAQAALARAAPQGPEFG